MLHPAGIRILTLRLFRSNLFIFCHIRIGFVDESVTIVRIREIVEINSSAIVRCVIEVRLIIVVIIILNYNLTRGIIP